MLFNSLVFVVFFAAVYTLYLLAARRYKAQNVLLLVGSYVFYGFWDWRFLSLIAVSTLVDFVVGARLAGTEHAGRRKRLLAVSVVANLGILGFFKYFNFFSGNLASLLAVFGLRPDTVTLQIVLPVGISFYTFQTLSYTIDIYRRRLEPTRDLLDFALFVAFFPQLVAGPIERARNLLPQISRPRSITAERVHTGLWLVLWGYFQKVVVADNCGLVADEVFNGYADRAGLDVIVGVLAFTMQIYADFAGYSSIARGVARLMGFDLMLNFRLPYFAVSPSDFWTRWHISLSSWLRDYLYIPLGGNRRGARRTYVNLLATMALGGLWHGAAWNFVIWGLFHGVVLIAYRVLDRRENPHEAPRPVLLGRMALMFLLVVFGWMIFRSRSVDQIVHLVTHAGLSLSADTLRFGYHLLFLCTPLLLVEVWQYRRGDLLAPIALRAPLRVPLYAFLLVWIVVFGVRESLEFIYFQF